jgi:hypothetical protein
MIGRGSRRGPHRLAKEYRHHLVPKNKDLEVKARTDWAQTEAGASEEEEESREEAPTTLMIRNIPNRYTRADLLEEMEDLGLSGTFDFFYLPLDQCRRHRHHGYARKTMSNLGYAFVNFIDSRSAKRCQDVLQDKPFTRHRLDSKRVADICVAHIQGLEANLAHYESAVVSGAKFPECRPMMTADLSR